MPLPVVVAPLVGWLASVFGVAAAEFTLGFALKAIVGWFIRAIATKFLGKVLFFGVFMLVAEFMPNFLVWLFGCVGDAVLTIAGSIGDKLSGAMQNNVDQSQVQQLFNDNYASMPQSWKDTMAYLNIVPLIGMIITTYSTMLVIDIVNSLYSAYTFGHFGNSFVKVKGLHTPTMKKF